MSFSPDLDRQLREILVAVTSGFNHINRRLSIMDARIEKVTADFKAFVDKVMAYVSAAESAKATVSQQIADAVAKDDADEDVDFAALSAAIQTAYDAVPAAPAAPTTA